MLIGSARTPLRTWARGVCLAALVGCSMLTAVGALAADVETCELTIEILGLESDKGKLVVALLDTAEGFEADAKPMRDERVSIKSGRGDVTLKAVPYGHYAAKIFHDENANEELDTNFVGFPKESFGFSNDAMGKFGPPSFEQAKFAVSKPKLTIQINMK